MDEIPTLILSNRFSEDSNKMWQAALELGWDVERIFNWNLIRALNPAKPVIYGEPMFNQFVAEQLQMTLPVPWPDFLQCISEEYTKRKINYLPAAEVRKIEDIVFLKPPNDKTFPAKVYDSGRDLPEFVQGSEKVLISEPVWWLSEFRFFVLDRKIKTHSIYSYKGSRIYKNNPFPNTKIQEGQCIKLVEEMLSDETVFLPRAIVIDCGVIHEKGPAIIEANEANGSGIYECDPKKVLEVLENTADKY